MIYCVPPQPWCMFYTTPFSSQAGDTRDLRRAIALGVGCIQIFSATLKIDSEFRQHPTCPSSSPLSLCRSHLSHHFTVSKNEIVFWESNKIIHTPYTKVRIILCLSICSRCMRSYTTIHLSNWKRRPINPTKPSHESAYWNFVDTQLICGYTSESLP